MHDVELGGHARRATFRVASLLWISLMLAFVIPASAEPPGEDKNSPPPQRGQLSRVKHIIVVMQENHSFDNYFGVLPYAVGSPYRSGPCKADDNSCVDALSCSRHPKTGAYHCNDANRDDDKEKKVRAFHLADYCVKTDLDHSWLGTHKEVNFVDPNAGLRGSPNDGFVLLNDLTNQRDNLVDAPTDDQTMGFYNEDDLGFYYDLAKVFALSDRHFSSVLGPTFPNRAYLMAATSFGHLTTSEQVPDITKAPFLVYRPLTGTIFDLLDKHGVSWANYYQDVPQATSFRNFLIDPMHFRFVSKPGPAQLPPNPFNSFFEDAQAGTLPSVAFVDPNFGVFNPATENDEHPGPGPGGNIRAGQSSVARILEAVRNSPNWPDTIVLIAHDEHGGFFDHVAPPPAPQGGARTPDGIAPGQCADASNLPASAAPGGGLNCTESKIEAAQLCSEFSPIGLFPAQCASFDQLGVRVPLLAVSPFSKRSYVSHRVTDHTSILALIERRFLTPDPDAADVAAHTPHLTARDAHADTLEDLFDFESSPSLGAPVNASLAIPPSSTDIGCTP
jgi:phospholipase C